MKIRILAVGKIKSKYISEGVGDFSVRLLKYVNLDTVEVRDEKPREGVSTKDKEGERLISAIADGDFVICLDPRGKRLSTEEFAELLSRKKMDRTKRLVFVIGGSDGLSDDVQRRADLSLSLSSMTFTHELARLVLAEQLYRAEKINCGEPYHK